MNIYEVIVGLYWAGILSKFENSGIVEPNIGCQGFVYFIGVFVVIIYEEGGLKLCKGNGMQQRRGH